MFGLFARIARISGSRRTAAPRVREPAPARPAIEVPLAALDARAQSAVRRHSRQIMDLAYVRTALGRDWPRVAPRLGLLVGQMIAQQIGNRGCFARDGERYLILFERTSERAAQAKVEKIAAAIARLLPGKLDADGRRAAVNALAGHPPKRVGWFRRIMARLFHRRKPASRAPAPAAAAAAAPTVSETPAHDAPPQAVATVRVAASHAPRLIAIAAARASAAPVPAAVQWPVSPQPGELQLGAPRPRKLPIRRSGPREFPPPGLTFVYQPLWEVRAGRITTFIAMPVCDDEKGMLIGHEVVPGFAEPRHLAQLDEFMIRQAIKDLAKAPVEGGRIGISVHFSTLADRARRTSYLMRCADLPKRARERMVIEMIDTPDETPVHAIEIMVRELRVFVRDVVAQLPVYQWDLRRWKEAGVISVGVNRARNSMNETEFCAKFNRFAALASDAGLRSYLQNADTLSLSVAAVGAGATLVSGPLIADFDMSKRFEIVPYGLEELYEQPARKAAAAR